MSKKEVELGWWFGHYHTMSNAHQMLADAANKQSRSWYARLVGVVDGYRAMAVFHDNMAAAMRHHRDVVGVELKKLEETNHGLQEG